MTYLRHFAYAVAALLAALSAGPAMAQAAPDIVGDWHGNAAVQTGDQMMALTVTRGADGALSGKFENRDVAPGRRDQGFARGWLTMRDVTASVSYLANNGLPLGASSRESRSSRRRWRSTTMSPRRE